MGRKHTAWASWRKTAPGVIPSLTSEVDDDANLAGGWEGIPQNPNEDICTRCLKPLDGRVVETLDGDRVHGECYVRGGAR